MPQAPPSIYLGAAYYPEHWPEARWPEDVRLMREAGFTVARLAEFAWSTMEPQAGQFEFDWLEGAIELLADNGIVTVLGTPTAAPPAWLVQAHPQLMAVGEDGRPVQFGNRCHYCVNAPEMHEASKRIVSAMASRFGDHPRVIGWQLDNEYNRVCYCDRCQAVFQNFLRERFETLDALNEAWTTRYWSQTYSDWLQIPIPRGRHNPGLRLAFQQFVTDSYRHFQQMQIDLLRPHLANDVWITHNFMGWFPAYDHYEVAEALDLASWDWYIGTGHHDPLNSGATHDLTRGFKQKNFWLMETQPGNVNWSGISNTLNKGEARAMAWHAVAHGADAILYWQWRGALNGQEQYHGTLVDQSGRPRPFYQEAAQLGADFAAIGGLLRKSRVPAEVALLNDYESRWAINWEPHHEDFDYVEHFFHYYRPLAARNIAIDVISADARLEGYALVVAPALLIVDEARAKRLADYVRKGGHLLLTVRAGMRDRYNAMLPSRQPGPLQAAAGVEVEEYYALFEPVPVVGPGLAGTSKLWAERLRPLDNESPEIWARYGSANGWLDGQPAITAHQYGDGAIIYVGAYLDEASQQALLDRIAVAAGVPLTFPTPPGVEVRCRRTAEQDIYLVINHTRADIHIPLPWSAHEHLQGSSVEGALLLAPYDVAVLTRSDA